MSQQTDIDAEQVEALVEQQQQLVERVNELEDELHAERQTRRHLSRALAELEVSFETETGSIRNKYDRRTFNNSEDILGLEERVSDIERGEVDPGEVVANSSASIDPSELLPLHNMYLSATKLEAEDHDLSNNQEIAARLFPYLGQYAYANGPNMVLPSTKVKDILEREIASAELGQRLDVVDPNANTVRRAMKFVGQFGQDMMEFDTSEKTNRIVIDRDAWTEYTNTVSEIASGDYDGVNSTEEEPAAEETGNTEVEEATKELDQLSESVITVS